MLEVHPTGGAEPGAVRSPGVSRDRGVGPRPPVARLEALRASLHLGPVQAWPLLRRALQDAYPVVRRRALSYIAWRRIPHAVASVIAACGDPDRTVRWAAIEALAVLQPDAARRYIQAVLPHLDAVGRRRAVFVLERPPQTR